MTIADIGAFSTGAGFIIYGLALARIWGRFETELTSLKNEVTEMRRESKEGDAALAATLAHAMARLGTHGEEIAVLKAITPPRGASGR